LVFHPAFCILSLVLLTSIATPSLAAPAGWAATYGGSYSDSVASIQQTGDGGYIVAGRTDSFGAGHIDVWVLKLRPDGTVEWQKTYGGGDWDVADSIQQTADGGYVVIGKTKSFGAGRVDFLVLKLRQDGTVEWQKTYGGAGEDWASSIQQSNDGGYIVVGNTCASFGDSLGMWVLKLQPDGAVAWQKSYGGSDAESGHSIWQTADGGYIVVGDTYSFGAGGLDIWVLKLRSDGTVEWQKTYGGESNDVAHSIRQTNDEGYIVAGETKSFGVGDVDLWVLKLRAEGMVEWQKTCGGKSKDVARSIRQTSDGGYIVVGETESFGAGDVDLWVLKLRADGTVEWQKTYGGGSFDFGYSIQQTGDGGYIAAGYTGSFYAEIPDIWVLKLGSDGSINPACDFIYDVNTSEVDSNATILDSSASVLDSGASPQDAATVIHNTGISANVLCQ